MTRDLDPATSAELIEEVLRPALFFEAEFAAGRINFWTGLDTKIWNARFWTGLGNLIGISDLTETDQLTAEGMSVTLSGIPLDLVQIAIEEARQGLPGRVWLALLDDAGEIVGDPIQLFEGRLDVPIVEDGTETATITISYEGRMIDLLRPSALRWTHESQQTLHPGDRGFEYVPAIQDLELVWGR